MFNQGTLKRKLHREIDDGQSIGFQRTFQVTQEMIHRLGLEKELEGHQGCVNCLEWNEKGTLLASGSDDVQIIVWNPFRHKCLTTLRTGHQGNIFSLKFLPNSNDSIIVSGAADFKIRVHDVNIQETTHVFGCHAGRVKRLATAPNVPFMFWSAAEDGTIMCQDQGGKEIVTYLFPKHFQPCHWLSSEVVISIDSKQFDLRTPESCDSTPRNVLINLNAHMGLQAEAKCIAINPLRPDEMAVGANDPYVRVYDRRMLSCKSIKFPTDNGPRLPWDIPVIHPSLKEEDYSLHAGCVQYFVAGHLPQKQMDYRKRYRTLASTYVTYSPDGSELLVNLGGEQIYLFDVNKKRKPQKFDMSLVLGSTNGIVKEAAFSSNGFSFPHRTGTNGVRTPLVPKPSSPTSSTSSWSTLQEEDVSEKYTNRTGKRHKRDSKHLSPSVEALKRKANSYFEKNQCTKAIILYNQAISMMPHASVLYGNRAAAYMKRKWDGDLYAALRDCHSALQLDFNYLKAHYRLARCLYELSWPQEAHDCLQQFKSKFPDYAKNSACEALDRDIKAAMFSKTDHDDSEASKNDSDTSSRKRVAAISEQEKVWRNDAYDYEMRFCGHCNTTTDIKEANFFGSNGQYIVAGSDDGSFFIWEKSTTNIVRVLRGDESIVNCLQPHPSYCLLATSGIDPVVRLWSPRAEDGSKNEREIDNSDDAALANQRRMNADPLEVMLMNMGYRITGVLDMEDEDDQEGDASNSRGDQHAHCRPS